MEKQRMTCQDALRKLFDDPQTHLTREAVYKALDKTYPAKPWKRSTIYAHLNSLSINHPLRKYHPNTEGKCFLFWDGDKTFRKWIPEQDGKWVLRNDGIVRVGGDGIEEPVGTLSESEDSVVPGPVSLSIERDLEDSIVQNLGMLEPGLTLYRDGDMDGRQLDTGAVGIVDLLALDKNGDFVVIELKAGTGADSVCGQILGYMAWVRKELAGDRKVRGIIVASDFSDRLRYAAEGVTSLSLVRYSVTFNFAKVALPEGGTAE